MNNEDIKREIDALKNRVAALEAWKTQRTRQQITFPLDVQSRDILNKDFMRVIGQYIYFGGVAGLPFLVIEGIQDKKRFEVSRILIEYKADPSSDVIRILYPSDDAIFANDETVVLYTTDTAPGGLSDLGLTTYYVVSAASDGNSFKLAATVGGAAINITSEGVGRQFLSRI